MVGIVLVSHSHALAVAARDLALGVSGAKAAIAIAAGAGDDRAAFGTNAVEIAEAIQAAMSDEGVVVLMDMGSAILSAETALGFLDEAVRAKVRCSGAPFIEGAVAASVVAGLGSSLDEVYREAEAVSRQKAQHLQSESTNAAAAVIPADIKSPSESLETVRVVVRNPHGLHARPAARFIREASAYQVQVTVRNVSNGRGPVSARSLGGLASLEALQGNEIEISASGANAAAALSALQTAVERGLGEAVGVAPPVPKRLESGAMPVSDGLAIGPLYFASAIKTPIPETPIDDPEAELRKLHDAIEGAKAELAREEKELKSSIGSAEAEIFQAQALVLDDPELVTAVEANIRNERKNAAFAWDLGVRRIIESYGKLEDEYLRQRAVDVQDVSARVLEALGVPRPQIADLRAPGIVVVEDLTPAEVTKLPSSVTGVILLQGGATSHAAILLRARGIPAIAHAQGAIDAASLDRSALGKSVAAFDGSSGELWLNPDASKLTSLREEQERQQVSAEEQSRHRHEAAQTSDGQIVTIFANLGQVSEAANALDRGAEGVGLFRTEFLFLDRTAAPSEEEQYAALRELRETFGTRPVVIRTLDIGGDKNVPYLNLAKEANPFLGVRGIRLCLSRPDLFLPHLRAILRAGYGGDFRVMFPMIADLAELIEAKAALEEAHQALDRDSIQHAWPVPVGIMIEVPSAALLADQLASHADFFSIGTNDLTQYVMAADRGNAALSRHHDAMHPSVLRLIQQVTGAAHRNGRHVAVCGEAAADAAAARILVGLGVDELSITAARIPAIKAAIRASSIDELKTRAARAMNSDFASGDAGRTVE